MGHKVYCKYHTTGMQRAQENWSWRNQPTVLCCFELLADEERPAAKKATESQEKERTLFFVSYSADNARTVQYHGYIIDFIFRLSQKNQLEIFFTSFHFVSF